MGPLSRAVTACRPVGDSDSSADCPRGASRAIFALAAGEDAIPAPARAIGAGRLPADKLLDTWRSSDSDHWHHCAPRARDRRAVRACVRPRRAEREQGGDGRRVALRRRGLVAPPRRESPPDSACWQSHDHRWRACNRQPGAPHAGTEPGGCSGTSRCADSEGRHPAKKAQAHEAGPGREGAATGREETPSRCEGYAGPAPRQRRLV